ncbi:Endonuclease/exonuclease/phosphatase [Artemisia annua]|uniref:Endonuclease/exonuclease/phosphatase n=1 Tax=Artemisia annua TaxID=35608 RepID=A0A2U1KHV6_ARTAN|nr:Endonuclease/exonuclease/phosphatase [Artemisia annua]
MIRNFWVAHSIDNNQNKLITFKDKLKHLKFKIKAWNLEFRRKKSEEKNLIQDRILVIDKLIDDGLGSSNIAEERGKIQKRLLEIEHLELQDIAQKAKIKWSIEGDENSKYYHGILKQKRRQLAIRGIRLNGAWTSNPQHVKMAFMEFFKKKFDRFSGGAIQELLLHGFQLSPSTPDRLIWSEAPDLSFSVKQARCTIDHHILPIGSTSTLWNRFVPRKVNIFFWRCRLNRLPTRVNLDHKGLDVPSILCSICASQLEDSDHIFFVCPTSHLIWKSIGKWCDLDFPTFSNVADMITWVDNAPISRTKTLLLQAINWFDPGLFSTYGASSDWEWGWVFTHHLFGLCTPSCGPITYHWCRQKDNNNNTQGLTNKTLHKDLVAIKLKYT